MASSSNEEKLEHVRNAAVLAKVKNKEIMAITEEDISYAAMNIFQSIADHGRTALSLGEESKNDEQDDHI